METEINMNASNISDNCFVCKVYFDRNLKKSRRRILRERDDLVSPFLYLLHSANSLGTWFASNDICLNTGPLPLNTTEQLQQMFACRKCFEKVIKLEKDVINFEKEISQILDQSCDTLLNMNIIRGDDERVKQLQNQQLITKQRMHQNARKVKKNKSKLLPRKKKKVLKHCDKSYEQLEDVQSHQHKTKQIFVLAKAQEGDQQQLLLLQVPDNDSNINSSEQLINSDLDHNYHEDDNQAIFLSSSAIPVTTCVTVTSEDQVLEVQIEHEPEEQEYDPNCEENKEVEIMDTEDSPIIDEEHDNYSNSNEETCEAVNAISHNEINWPLSSENVIVVNKKGFLPIDESYEEKSDEACESLSVNCKPVKQQKTKENYTKRTYNPRSCSPLPAAGESRVVVHLMYGSKQWKRPMEGEVKSIIRDMALYRPEPAGRKIAASDKLCPPVIKNYAKRLVSECKEAARTIRVSDHQDVTQLDMKSFTAEVFQKCSKTANLIKSLIPIEPRDTLDEHGATAVIMGVILYMHSMQSNTLQHILSYVLRRAGCNREGFKTLHSLGLTLSYTSILKVMNDIDAKPDVIEKSSLDTIEKSINSVVVRTKTESNDKLKKKTAPTIAQEIREPESVLMQFTLPYYTTTGRTQTVSYTTNTLTYQNNSQSISSPYDTCESSVV